MKITDEGVDLIKRYEGFRAKAYSCPAGKLTIGYGTTRGVEPDDRVTRAEAEDLLMADIRQFEREVKTLIRVPVNRNQFSALVSFAYNLGADNLRKSTLRALVNRGDYSGAADQFPRWVWATVGGRRKKLGGLIKRREEERALFLKPVACS